MNSDISIDILKRMSRSSIGLRVTDDGRVEIRAPYFIPHFVINRFVQSKRDWIIRAKQAVLTRSKVQKIEYREGGVIQIASNSYGIHITDGNAIVLVGSRIFFPKKFLSNARLHMERWCRVFAKKFLAQRLDTYAAQMHVRYARISIRDTSTRWGSCSNRGTISFSYRLIFADLSIIDYVVIHELSHLTHHNHRKVFWDRVALFYPEYKVARMWLRQKGHTLKL